MIRQNLFTLSFGLLMALPASDVMASVAHSVRNQDDELISILKAQSPDQIQSSTERSVSIQSNKDDCLAQLALNVLPRSCFGVLKEIGKTSVWMARECVRRAEQSESRIDLEQSRPDVPDKCQASIDERIADLNYLDEGR